MKSLIWTGAAVAALLAGANGAAIAAVPSRSDAPASVPADTARGLIPVGSVRVARMELMAPPRLQELMGRMQAALQGRQEWWQQYVRENAKPGGVLPYHANLGLSEAEYDEMLGLYEQMKMAPVGQATLAVRVEGEGRFVLDGGTDLPDLTGVVIDLANDRVETPFGATNVRGAIEPSEAQSATGPWGGVSWRLENVDAATASGVLVNFSVGRLSESGRGILHYEARRMANGAFTGRADVTLTYDLPTP